MILLIINMSNSNKKIYESGEEINDLVKKLIILELFKMGVPQADIGRKLHLDIKFVNSFLKGIKKKND